MNGTGLLIVGVIFLLISWLIRLWERRDRRRNADKFFDKFDNDKM